MEVESAAFIYCAEQTTNNITKWISFSLKGDVLEEETEVAIKDLPAEVSAATAKEKPAGKIASASKVKAADETYFSVTVNEGKTSTELKITPAGKVESAEVDDDDTTQPAPQPGRAKKGPKNSGG